MPLVSCPEPPNLSGPEIRSRDKQTPVARGFIPAGLHSNPMPYRMIAATDESWDCFAVLRGLDPVATNVFASGSRLM